jgi:Class II flagellar assembly regulator
MVKGKPRARQKSMSTRLYPAIQARQDLPPGTDDPVGATDMVDGVRLDGIGGAMSVPRDDIKTPEGKFAVNEGATPPANKARLSTTAGIDLDSMLALQAVDEATEHDRTARKRGTAMIAALIKLQRITLAQQDASQTLSSLIDLTADSPAADDPGLEAILRAIKLRARVEIALRQRPAA